MTANVFDQFDDQAVVEPPAARGGNVFDRFDNAPAPAPAPQPRRQVGVIESALRTAGEAARAVVGTFDMAAGGLASLLGGQSEAERVFKMRDERQQLMRDAYAPKENEEFSTAGSLIGGIASAPIEIAGGMGVQRGVQRSADVIDRGGSLGEAGRAGAVTGGVNLALNALPVKAGGRVGAALESRLGAALGGAATGAGITAAGGAAGRVAGNAALPGGDQYADLRQDVAPSAAEVGLGAVLGAVPGARQAASRLKPGERSVPVRAAQAAVDATTPRMDPAKAELAGKAIDAGIPLRPDMLTQNKFVRTLGEIAETTPLGGGKGKERREAFSQGLHQMIDPDGKGPLTPSAYDAAMTKAGETIGDISARTPIPESSLRNIGDVGRRETPDVQKVISTYVDDLAAIAEQNGGTIPGETFRKLRSEASAQMRSSNNGDLRRTLGDFVKRMDDALSDHAAEADLDALADARQRYAVGMALQDVVGKSPDGNISPSLILGRAMKDQAGKRRMARGKGGDLGDYAYIGQEFLKEQPSSGTAERSAIIHGVAHAAVSTGKLLLAVPFAQAYNRLGPRIARRMIERERARNAPPPEAPPPELSAEQAPFEPQGPAPRDARLGDPRLGDITPEWQTEAGATPAGPRQEVVPTEGLVRAVDEPAPAQEPGLRMLSEDEYPRQPAGNGIDFVAEPDLAGVQPPDWTLERGAGAARAPGVDATEMTPALGDHAPTTGQNRTRAGRDIPAAEGLPGVDEVAVAGGPGNFVDAAPGALDRLQERPRPAAESTEPAPPRDARLQEIDRLKAEATSDVVRKALDEQAKAVQKDIDSKAKADKARADADEMRALAAKTEDPGLKKALQEQAEKLSPAEVKAAPQTGSFGPVFTQFHHDAKGAIDHLRQQKTGDARGAIHHADVGDIDLVWGKEGTPEKGFSDGYGLAKIAHKHPEVLDDLQGFLNRLHKDPARSGKNRTRLVDARGNAVVRLDWQGDSKTWLLSAYERKPGASTRTDTASSKGEGDTARLTTGQPDSTAAAPVDKDAQSLADWVKAQKK